MSNPNQCVVTVSAPPRSAAAQNPVQFVAAEASCTWSWGLQPATAFIDWVSVTQQPAVVSLASMKIELGGHTFYGYCKSVVPKLGTDGISLMQEFVDNRDFLQWDMVYGVFNMPEHKIVNGQFIRRYWHILPWDFNTRTKTYTNAPFSAETVLEYLFDAPTIESPWYRLYFQTFAEYSALGTPVFQLDFENGVTLGQAVLQITEAIGMVFTLMGGPYTLQWTIKGLGSLPPFPANSDNRRSGTAVTTNPTRVRILGDRNRYQVLDCALIADWLPAWQASFGLTFEQFVADIHDFEATNADSGGVAAGTRYNAIPSDTDGQRGWSLARARALLLTVGQYADLRDARNGTGSLFRDARRFQGRSRTQLPVSLYLSEIVWRAFRLPANFTVRLANGARANLYAVDLEARPVVDVTHDPVTGEMFYTNDTPPSSEHNGYAIAQGFQVNAEAFNSLRPDYFNLTDFINAQMLWNTAAFQIDDSGEGDQFVVFDEPVLQTGNLIKQIVIAGVPQTYPDGRPRMALDATQMPAVPPVRAALTFLGEKFSYIAGVPGTRDGVENVTGLNGEFVGRADGSLPFERNFADGQTATQKAAAIAATLLNQQFLYNNGGYLVQGSNATQLSSLIDRVTVRLSENGLSEEVDFTNERARNVTYYGPFAVAQIEPEREFDRKAQLSPLFPGQEQLRVEANQQKLDAASLGQDKKQAQMIADTFHRLHGYSEPPPTTALNTPPVVPVLLPFGTPLFRDADKNLPVVPDNATVLTTPVFVGVTVMDNQTTAGQVAVTATGASGIVQARVKLAATDQPKAGDPVGLAGDKTARDYFVTNPGQATGTLVDDFSHNTTDRIVIARVRFASAGGGGTQTFQITAVASLDYFTARTWDGTTQGTTDYLIAKAIDFRPSYLNETIDGVPIVHTYGNDNDRTSNDGTNPVQTEKCWPRFVVGAEVQGTLSANATPVKDANGAPVQWIDTTKRVWLAITPTLG